jgi:hypothetical protein
MQSERASRRSRVPVELGLLSSSAAVSKRMQGMPLATKSRQNHTNLQRMGTRVLFVLSWLPADVTLRLHLLASETTLPGMVSS